MPPPISPPPGELHLWFTSFADVADASVERYAALLDDEERGRRARFHFERDRRSYAISHALLRTTLARYAAVEPRDWRFAAGPYGRPEIATSQHGNLRFNLSHTRGGALVGVVRHRDVGVDLETLDRSNDCDALAARYFAPAEVAALGKLPDAERRMAFFDFWTLKEAYVKARGLGLHLPLDQFAFTLQPAGGASIDFDPSLGDEAAAWQFALWRPASNLRAAVAVRVADGGPLRIVARRTIPLESDGPPETLAPTDG